MVFYYYYSDGLSGLRSFVPAVLFPYARLLFFPSSPASFSYFFLVVSISECFGKHSCMSSFPIAILNGTFCQGKMTFYISLANG